MRYATGAKMLGCTVVGATLLLGGAGALGGLDMAMAQSSLLPVETMQRNAVDYDKVANVSGDFTFCQDVVTPADEVFNLFGTATTALCAKPGYAFDAVTHESYYLNIGGNVEKVYTVGLDEIERMDSKIQKMRCTCGMSPALAMASVKGVKVSDMLSMTDIAPEVNTITFKDKDGYGLPMPLSYVLEKEALLVYQIDEQKLSEGERLQVWMPDTVVHPRGHRHRAIRFRRGARGAGPGRRVPRQSEHPQHGRRRLQGGRHGLLRGLRRRLRRQGCLR